MDIEQIPSCSHKTSEQKQASVCSRLVPCYSPHKLCRRSDQLLEAVQNRGYTVLMAGFSQVVAIHTLGGLRTSSQCVVSTGKPQASLALQTSSKKTFQLNYKHKSLKKEYCRNARECVFVERLRDHDHSNKQNGKYLIPDKPVYICPSKDPLSWLPPHK